MNKYDCEYNEVPNTENCTETYDGKHKVSWKPLLRQVLISSGTWTIYFQLGMCIGTPTVLMPQMRREANSTEIISQENASWLSSALGFFAVPWGLVLPVMTWYFGRRAAHATVVLLGLAGFITLYFSKTLTQIFVSMAMLSILCSAIMAVGLLILTEYISPVNRGLCLTIKSASCFWGVWVANAIGTFFDWRNIALVGILSAIYNVVTLVAWPESPYWLADQDRLEDCRLAFRWIRGNDEKSEAELEELIKTRKTRKDAFHGENDKFKYLRRNVTSKCFYKPTLLSIVALFLYQSLGKIVVTVYALDILGKIASSEQMAYRGMLILDGVSVLSMYCGCGLSQYLPRRVHLITTTSGGIACLFLMSLYLFLKKHSLISENIYISLSLLSVLSLCSCCGVLVMSSTICGELMPLTLRGLNSVILSLFAGIYGSSLIKVAPYLLSVIGLDGLFLLFGVSSFIFLTILYKYLPETKDKTLGEISALIVGS